MSELIIPNHISIIMDGNGRWAKQRGCGKSQGHYRGLCGAGSQILVSIHLFGGELEQARRGNIRSDGAFGQGHKERILYAYEKRGAFPCARQSKPALRCASILYKSAGKGYREERQARFVRYSGRWDILQAVQAIVKSGKKAEEIDYDTVSAALVTAGIPDPDLVIRTSGEKRISNYMLWQTAYSEFVFTDTLWPDFRKEELLSAIKEYSGRDRRFGKVK